MPPALHLQTHPHPLSATTVHCQQFKFGQFALKVPVIGPPAVRFAVDKHVKNHVFGDKREVAVKVVTLSSLFKEHGIKCVAARPRARARRHTAGVGASRAAGRQNEQTGAPVAYPSALIWARPLLPPPRRSISLLKVDTECADLMVLQGIADEDWPMIRQVTMEVCARER